MKKSTSVLIAAAAAIVGLCASSAHANLITNPSWETGDTSGWTQTFNVNIGPATVLTDSRALDGTHMLGGAFPVAQGGVGYVQYEDRTLNLQFQPNTIYTWTIHAFTDDPNLAGQFRLVIGSAPTSDGVRDVNEVDTGLIGFTAGSGTVLAPDGITMWNQLTATLDTSVNPAAVGRWIVPTFDLENGYMDQAIFVPEPGSFALLSIGGLFAVAAVVRRRLRN